MLKAIDIVGLSWLTFLFSVAGRSGTEPLEWQTRVVVPILKKGDWRVCSNYQCIKSLLQGARKEALANCQTSDSGGTLQFPSWSWNNRSAFYPCILAYRGLGVCRTNLHVFCELGKGLWLGPLGRTVGVTAGVSGTGPFTLLCYPVPVWPRWELYKSSLLKVGVRQGCSLSLTLFVIFRDRISRRCRGEGSGPVPEPKKLCCFYLQMTWFC